MPYIQGPKYSEEDLFVRERVPRGTYMISFNEPGTNGKHELVGKMKSNGSSSNIQKTNLNGKYISRGDRRTIHYTNHQKYNIAYVPLDPVSDYVYIADLIIELCVG